MKNDPKPAKDPKPTMPAVDPEPMPVTASKKGDDISKNQSKPDSKPESKQMPGKAQASPQHPYTKPAPDNVRK